MSDNDYTAKLLDMKGVNILDITNNKNSITIKLEMKVKPHMCPACNTVTERVHDYRFQKVKDLPFQGKPILWLYKKRRYACTCCFKRFYESNYLLPKYHRITNRTALYSLNKLGERRSHKSVALELGVSLSTVCRWMKLVDYSKPKLLPKVLSIDEFKGNTDREKFQGILTDPVKKQIFDILPNRKSTDIMEYFRGFSNRHDVKFFVMDMNKSYLEVAKCLFPKATVIIDRFHVSRYCTWGFENVRRKLQKKLLPEDRKYFKRSRKLLLKRASYLNDNNADAVALMLSYDTYLSNAYYLKELFYEFMDSKNSIEAKQKMKNFLFAYETFEIKEFLPLARVLRNWTQPILNSFDYRYSNGFTEGINNSIKVLKRTAYGYRNFDNFRRRIMHIQHCQKEMPMNS